MGRLVLHWVCVCALGVFPLVGCAEVVTAENTGGTSGTDGEGGDAGAGGTGARPIAAVVEQLRAITGTSAKDSADDYVHQSLARSAPIARIHRAPDL